MKRIVILATGLAAAALVACWQTGKADDNSPPQSAVPTARSAPSEGTVASKGNDNLQELLKILNETKSPYTLVATAVALVPMGEKAKQAVPTILRNAERLKLLDSLGNPGSRKADIAEMLLEAIVAIQAGWSPDDGPVPPWRWQPRTAPVPPEALARPPQPPFYGPPGCPSGICPAPAVPLPAPGGASLHMDRS
jgi:hypothetical protein